MYGEVTSRNHQAYSWGHLVHNNTDYINIAAVCGFAISEITFLGTPADFARYTGLHFSVFENVF